MSGDELPEDLTVPDDLSGLTDDAEPSLALIITQVAGAEPLVAACALAKVPVDAFPTPIGAVASCRELSAGGPERAAAAISELLKTVPVVLIERRESQLSAARWENGERTAELPAGLVLDGAPAELEDLVTGTRDLDEIDGVLTSVGMSRFRAMRQLGALARKARKQP
ncbi:MAG: hypothetical protein ACTMIR_08620 [Cellulomonadaceae bacterium]